MTTKDYPPISPGTCVRTTAGVSEEKAEAIFTQGGLS